MDVELRDLARSAGETGCTLAAGGGEEGLSTGGLRSHDTPLAAMLDGEDFPTPRVRPIAMPTQQLDYWTPALVFAALAGLVRRWRAAPLFEPDTPESRQSRA